MLYMKQSVVMREVKSFFIEDNSLNKGYTIDKSSTESQSSAYYKKLQQNLPPVDVIAAYEELHPGTLAKLLDAVEKEQKHSHATDHVHGKIQQKATYMGRMFGFFSVLAISYVTLSLAQSGMLMGGLIFAGMAFTGIFGVSFFMSKGRIHKPYNKHRFNRPSYNRNNAMARSPEGEEKKFYRNRGPNRNNRRPR